MTIQDIFSGQDNLYGEVSKDIYDKITYKRTTFNNLIEIGDKVFYFYLTSKDNHNDKKLGSVLKKNINLLSHYEFHSFEDEIIPVFIG